MRLAEISKRTKDTEWHRNGQSTYLTFLIWFGSLGKCRCSVKNNDIVMKLMQTIDVDFSLLISITLIFLSNHQYCHDKLLPTYT